LVYFRDEPLQEGDIHGFLVRCSVGDLRRFQACSNQDSEVKKINDKMIVALCKQSLLEKSLATYSEARFGDTIRRQ
jgi:hypothetical protein